MVPEAVDCAMCEDMVLRPPSALEAWVRAHCVDYERKERECEARLRERAERERQHALTL